MRNQVMRQLSKIPAFTRAPLSEDKQGYLACQRLAQRAVADISGMLREGWTEQQAAKLLNSYLVDNGVRGFFHEAFVWFGDRTRFEGVRNYAQYSPTDRALLPGEIFILDVAPILDGYTCDIGYTSSLGPNRELDRAMAFLSELRREIPRLFQGPNSGGEIWRALDQLILDAGFDNIHAKYPFSVLGHRVHRVTMGGRVGVLNFGWQSYWQFLSRGLFGQLLNGDHEGSLDGLWAIEPHIGGPGFGAKFEEILVVENGSAHWLDDKAPGLNTDGLLSR